jgi:ABC-2 type transport system ATP-binding protein
VATVAVVAALALYARRRRGGPADPALAGVPLAIEGLGKRYADGFRAVSDVSFRVEHGWVLGLLGPNGAGKTTTLRMLMGLIAPTEGRIRIFGHPVRPGAPVLSRVGAFVEGPGFLPHVSGLENLRLFWGATGRPPGDAHLDEALEIAGLGDDVHRKVRTYSQGMRQRLAIAQAMLGLPDLLVLDEPTNGLDPPQIREMREVLGRYAATGRTVVVSSHLLSEVEQTCDHVVVMHQGRLVAQGEVADLVGSATALVVDVDKPERAAEVAASVDGAREVALTPTGITLKLVGTPRSELVRVLVAEGLAVDRITPQRGLEEAFLALVGEA